MLSSATSLRMSYRIAGSHTYGYPGRCFGVFTIAGIVLVIWQRKISSKQAPGAGLTQQQRDRQAMLNLVYNTWVKGLLQNSLYNEVLIHLKLETQPDAVEHPWNTIVQMPYEEPKEIPPGKTILEVFEEANESLLILGEPGSGKTTMLLELARQEIERAKTDSIKPIPVYFNLSSWTTKQTIDDWLVDELRNKYYISQKTSRYWVYNNDLMLLLDGLDELKSEFRTKFSQELNTYLDQHNVPLAICCRAQEYRELAIYPKLRGAILIQPLSAEQAAWYFRNAGQEKKTAYQILKDDTELQDFIQTPLALNILLFAFRDSSAENLKGLKSAKDRRKYLFDAYITQMFKRRGKNDRYTTEQTRNWLSYLSFMMSEKGRSIFYIESLDIGWLRYWNYVNQFRMDEPLFKGLIIGPILGLISWLIFDFDFIALFFGIIIPMNYVITFNPNIPCNPTERIKWSWGEFRNGLIKGLGTGLVWGLSGGVFLGIFYGLKLGLKSGLNYGLVPFWLAGFFMK